MAQEHQNCVDELKKMYEELNREIEKKKRRLFLRKLIPFIENWQGPLPNLRDIFRTEEIDLLLKESLKVTFDSDDRGIAPQTLIDFVIRTGYKDEPVLGADGKPSSRRDTPIHEAATRYHRSDCECYDEVEKFIKLGGLDPNGFSDDDHSPLCEALHDEKMFKLLLRYGADPCLSYAGSLYQELPLLHAVCSSDNYSYLYGRIFTFTDDVGVKVQIDAEDKNGRTPLQWAVAGLAPDAIDKLFDRGADLSKFVFPTEDHIAECFEDKGYGDDYKLIPASGLPAVVERLEKGGYVLDRNDAHTIMEFYVEHHLFVGSTDDAERWLDDEELAIKAKKLMIKPSLSVYNLLQLQPKEAAKLVTLKDYGKLEVSKGWWRLNEGVRQDFEILLCEKASRRFFQKWALDSFQDLTRHKLPILCGEMIVDQLINEDLYRIFLAATELRSRWL
uniref:Uncharacterized protein n=1 Tax=Trichogramma kaykai TaxID=54128 RepID=A0ABD2XMA3_9HYME